MAILLTSTDVKSLFEMKDFIEIVEECYKLMGLGLMKMLPRIHMDSKDTSNFLTFMPCTFYNQNTCGVFVYTRGNHQDIQKIILLFDTNTGGWKAIIEADRLSWMKTGASSAVATKYLARENAKTVGMIGSGRQARSQLMAIHLVRKIKLVKVYSPHQEHRLQYCKEMSELLDIEVIGVNEVKEAVLGLDIISTATTSKIPVFDGNWIEKGIHINAIGSHSKSQREVDETTVRKSKVVVDSRERALQEEGELLIPIDRGVITRDHIYAELGDIVAGRLIGREKPEEITLFTSGGISAEYTFIAAKVYEKALMKGIGQELDIQKDDSVPKAYKNLSSKRPQG